MIKTKKIVWKKGNELLLSGYIDGYIGKKRLFCIRKNLLKDKWIIYLSWNFQCNSIRQAKFQAKKLLQSLVEE